MGLGLLLVYKDGERLSSTLLTPSNVNYEVRYMVAEVTCEAVSPEELAQLLQGTALASSDEGIACHLKAIATHEEESLLPSQMFKCLTFARLRNWCYGHGVHGAWKLAEAVAAPSIRLVFAGDSSSSSALESMNEARGVHAVQAEANESHALLIPWLAHTGWIGQPGACLLYTSDAADE